MTVVIPTYNRQDLVIQTVQSVLRQSFRPAEIIVVDDGSTDGTQRALAKLIESGDVTYLWQENCGHALAKNRGLAAARGEFIAFLDSDDLWPADKLEWQVASLHETPDAELVGGTAITDLSPIWATNEDGNRLRISYTDIFWGCPFMSPGQVLIRTAAMRAVGGFDARMRGVDDFDLYVRLARRSPLLRVSRLALQYRDHPASMSKNRWQMFEAGAACLRARLPEVPLFQRWAMSRRAYRGLYNFVGREIIQSLRGSRWSGRTGYLQLVRRLIKGFGRGMATDPRLLSWIAVDLFGSLQRQQNVAK